MVWVTDDEAEKIEGYRQEQANLAKKSQQMGPFEPSTPEYQSYIPPAPKVDDTVGLDWFDAGGISAYHDPKTGNVWGNGLWYDQGGNVWNDDAGSWQTPQEYGQFWNDLYQHDAGITGVQGMQAPDYGPTYDLFTDWSALTAPASELQYGPAEPYSLDFKQPSPILTEPLEMASGPTTIAMQKLMGSGGGWGDDIGDFLRESLRETGGVWADRTQRIPTFLADMAGLAGYGGQPINAPENPAPYVEDAATLLSGNKMLETFTPLKQEEMEGLPYGLGYVTDAVFSPANWAAAAVAPTVPLLGATFKGPYLKNLAAEVGMDIGARVLGEQAAGETGESIPYFGDQPAWLRGLEGGLIGGLSVAGGIKGIDSIDYAAAGRSLAEGNPFAAVKPTGLDMPVGAIDPLTGRPFEWQAIMGGADEGFGGGLLRPQQGDVVRLQDGTVGVVGQVDTAGNIVVSGKLATVDDIVEVVSEGPIASAFPTAAVDVPGVPRVGAEGIAQPGVDVPRMDTGAMFESRQGITGRGVPEGRGSLAGGPVKPQTNLFGEMAEQPVFRGDESAGVMQARRNALDTLAENREIRRSGVTAAEIKAGRREQVGGVLAGFDRAVAEGKTGAELLDAAVDNIPSGRLIQTNAGALAPTDRDALKDVIAEWLQEAPGARAYEARTARDVVEAMASPQGYMPQPHEDALLRRILGDELTDTVSSRMPGHNVEGAKVEAPTRPLPLGEQTAPVQPPIVPLKEGEYLTEARRAQDFVEALEAKRAAAEEFMTRLRTRENPNASRMTLGGGAEQLSLDRAVPVKGIYPSNTPMPRQRTMTPVKVMQFARMAFGEAFALPRAIKSSLDLSAPLRQGAMLGWRHPKAAAAAFADQLRAFSSVKAAKRIDELLDARPNARTHKAAGLYRADWDEGAEISAREEAFLSRIATKVPGVRASNRAYAAYLNKLRADSFDAVWNSMDELAKTSENATALARFINVASGRGELPGMLEGAGPLLGQVLYSPRYVTSRPHALWMGVTGNGSAIARKEALKTLAAYFVGTSTMLALGKAGGVWDVELDPRSADFGKGRIGPLRYDFWTGYSQLARLAAQVTTGQTKSTRSGEVYDLDNRMQPFGRFIRSKLNPTTGLAVDTLTGSDYKGDTPPGPIDQIVELVSPISVQEVVDAYESYGWEMALATLPGFFGAGVSVYEPTAEDTLNELARQVTYTDAYGNEITGKNFRQLPPGQREKLLLEHPELATARIVESGEATQRADQRTQELTASQQASDTKRLAGQMSPVEWREDYEDRKNELRIRKEEIYYKAGTKPGGDPVLDAYYAAIDAAEQPDGKVDWDAVEAYMATLPESQRQYIDENTGFVRLRTPLVLQFEADQKLLADSGYFDATENKALIRQLDPEINRAVRTWGYSEASVRAEDITQRFKSQQEMDDRALQAGEITPDKWAENYADRRDQLRAHKDEIYAGFREDGAPVTGLDLYFRMIEQLTPNGLDTDWDAVDAWVATQPAELQNAVATYESPGLTDLATTYKADISAIADSGYFDRSKESWGQVVSYIPELAAYASYEDWQKAAKTAELARPEVQQWVAETNPAPEYLDSILDKVIAKQQPAKGMEYFNGQWRDDWVVNDPQVAYTAWKWGKWTPSQKIAAWLSEQYSLGLVH